MPGLPFPELFCSGRCREPQQVLPTELRGGCSSAWASATVCTAMVVPSLPSTLLFASLAKKVPCCWGKKVLLLSEPGRYFANSVRRPQ